MASARTFFNSFAADFLAPSAGKNIYVREIKLQTLTFVNKAKQSKAKQRCVMGVGMCLYAQLVQTKNK